MHHFGEAQGAQRRELAGLPDHRAACCEGSRELGTDELHRPVPSRDQATDPNGLATDDVVIQSGFEVVVTQRGDGLLECVDASARVGLHAARRPHLCRDGGQDLILARLEFLDDALQQGKTLFLARLAESRKCPASGRHGAIDVSGSTKADAREGLFVRGIDQHERGSRRPFDPAAVDVEATVMFHVLRCLQCIRPHP
ncbi:hypothetical protein D3C87_1318730 [compost metagenome]